MSTKFELPTKTKRQEKLSTTCDFFFFLVSTNERVSTRNISDDGRSGKTETSTVWNLNIWDSKMFSEKKSLKKWRNSDKHTHISLSTRWRNSRLFDCLTFVKTFLKEKIFKKIKQDFGKSLKKTKNFRQKHKKTPLFSLQHVQKISSVYVCHKFHYRFAWQTLIDWTLLIDFEMQWKG